MQTFLRIHNLTIIIIFDRVRQRNRHSECFLLCLIRLAQNGSIISCPFSFSHSLPFSGRIFFKLFNQILPLVFFFYCFLAFSASSFFFNKLKIWLKMTRWFIVIAIWWECVPHVPIAHRRSIEFITSIYNFNQLENSIWHFSFLKSRKSWLK